MSELTLNSAVFSSCEMDEKLRLLSILSKIKAVEDAAIIGFLAASLTASQAEELCRNLINQHHLPFVATAAEAVADEKTSESKKRRTRSSVAKQSQKAESAPANQSESEKTVRKRGRPKGSKNKPKDEIHPEPEKDKQESSAPTVAAKPDTVKPANKAAVKAAEEVLSDKELIERDKIGDELPYSLLYSYSTGVNKFRLVRSDYRLSYANCIGIFIPYLKHFALQKGYKEFILDIEEAKITPGTGYQKVCSLAADARPQYSGRQWGILTEPQMLSVKAIVEDVNEILRRVKGDAFKFHYTLGRYMAPSVKDKFRYTCDVL